MSQVEEEKYLTNRCKVERIKTKVKIRFKPKSMAAGRSSVQQRLAVTIEKASNKRSQRRQSSSQSAALMMISGCQNLIAKHWWACLLIVATVLTISDAVTLPRYSASIGDRSRQGALAAATMPMAVKLSPMGNSELSFEFLNLKTIPSDQLCQLVDSELASATTSNQINLV